MGASWPLERESFLAALCEAQRQVQGGSGRLVFVVGEAGVGKTALVRRFCSDATDMRVLEGACDALFTPRPLAHFADVAAETGGPVAELIARDARPHEVLAALTDELHRRPTVLVLEEHSNPPSLFGTTFNLTPDGNRFGIPAFYSLHAWVWAPNTSGLLQPWHPRVHC